jgi:Ni,Fe-hydrogenase I cytochrome b subunit
MVQPTDTTYGRLRVFNAAMGVLHLIQGVAMLILSTAYTLPLNQTLLNSQGISTQTTTVFNIRLGRMVAAFLLISAIAHFYGGILWVLGRCDGSLGSQSKEATPCALLSPVAQD